MREADSDEVVLRFGEFEADLGEEELRRKGKRIRLQEKPFLILAALLDRPGHLVTRTELCRLLWPEEEFGQFEERLNIAVNKLRQALGDSPTEPRFIETVTRRGYRFIAAVEARQRREEPTSSEAGLRYWISTKAGALVSASLLLALVVLAVAARFSLQRTRIPFAEREWLVVSDFENLTGDAVLDRSLATALKTGIRQSRYVNVLPDSRVAQALERMARESSSEIDEAVAAEVALREGARAILVGSVSQLGSVYEISARIVDPESKIDLAVEVARAEGRDRIIEALDEVIVLVRDRLGESRAAIRRDRVPLPQATTSSLEALETYAEGKALLVSDMNLATAALEEAIALDPNFALAHAQLGGAYYRQNDRIRGERHFEKALSLLDRLTHRERLWIQAEVEGRRGNREKAIEGYRLYLDDYPDDADGWFRLGYQYLASRRCEPAIDAFERALALYPTSGSAYINIATCQAFSGRYEEAIQSYARAFEVEPESRSYWVLRELGMILVYAERLDEAQALFREMVEGEAAERANGYRGLAFLEMLEGRFAAAVGHLRQAASIHHRLEGPGESTSELRVRLFLVEVLQRMGRRKELKREVENVHSLLDEHYVEPLFLALAGKVLARLGRSEELPQLLEQLTERVNAGNDEDLAAQHLLTGEIALLAGDEEEALHNLELATTLKSEPHYLESLARVCAVRGEVDRAIATYEQILSEKEWFGYEAQFPWMRAHYELGKLYEARGDVQRAAEHYGIFVDRWRHGDPDLVSLADARERLGRLRTEPAPG